MDYSLLNGLNSAKKLSAADKANLFTERMSSTAHQREVADLKAAGLNPVLSADSSGATTGSAAQDEEGTEYDNPIYEFIKGVNTFTKTSAKTVEEANKNLNSTIQNLLKGVVKSKEKDIGLYSDSGSGSPSGHSESSSNEDAIPKTYGESANSNNYVHNDAKQSVSNNTFMQKLGEDAYHIDGSDPTVKIKWSPLAQKMIPSKVRNYLESYGYINDIDVGAAMSDYLATPYGKSVLQGMTGNPNKAIKTFKKMIKSGNGAGSTRNGTSIGTRVVGKKSGGNYGYNAKRNYNVLMEK